jgi:hypothetical protein
MKRKASIGTPVNVKVIQKRVAEMSGVSDSFVWQLINKLDSIEYGTSASFSVPHKVRFRKSTNASSDT